MKIYFNIVNNLKKNFSYEKIEELSCDYIYLYPEERARFASSTHEYLEYDNQNNNYKGGGLMQLVAYGAQDTCLTGNPPLTFFKFTYTNTTSINQFMNDKIPQNINNKNLKRQLKKINNIRRR